MSFWPNIYDQILSQDKLIEYRRHFPKDCSYAYMYVTKPKKAICAIIYFGKIHSIEDWKKEYIENNQVIKRINEFNNSYKYGAEIIGIQQIEPISLESLRENIPNFVAPQSYLLLDNNPALFNYINSNTKFIGSRICNDIKNIYPMHICKKY